MDTRYDVVIVGAGPAGSAAAICLARAGRRVVVVERERFPREKVCGGCLSGRAMEILAGDLHLAGCPGVPTTGITFVRPSGRAVRCQVSGTARLVQRSEFDAWLVDHAQRAGASVQFGVTARPRRKDNGWAIDLLASGGEARNRQVQSLAANTILVAAGLSRLERVVGIRRIAMRRPMIGLQWTRNLQEDAASPPIPAIGEVAMHWLEGGYVGVSRPAKCILHIAAAIDARSMAGGSPLEGLRRRNRASAIWELLPPGAFSERAVAGFPSRPEALGKENVLLIGDAAGYAEPFSGEGIGLAMHSGVLAAKAVCSSNSPDAQLANYETLIRRHMRPAQSRCLVIGSALRLKPLARLDRIFPVVPSSWFESLLHRVHVRAGPAAPA